VQRLGTKLCQLQQREKNEVKKEWGDLASLLSKTLGEISTRLDSLTKDNKEALTEKEKEDAKARLERLKSYQEGAQKVIKALDLELDGAERLLVEKLQNEDVERKKLFEAIQQAQEELSQMTDESYQAQLKLIETIEKQILKFEKAYLN